MITKKQEYVDFGAISTFGSHLFRVEISSGRSDEVTIVEDYGYRGSENGIPKEEERVVLKRAIWSEISDVAQKEFNKRLKVAKLPSGKWHAGNTLLDRLLGKELCVLAWAAENAKEESLPTICSKWAALRPEERWWLFSMTVAESGLPEDSERGWRKALLHALSDSNKKTTVKRKPRPVESDVCILPLFGVGEQK